MTAKNRTPVRFSLLTVLVWFVVAGGIIFLLWRLITHISGSNLPVSTPTPNLTQVYQTIAAMLTVQHADSGETATQTATPTPTSRFTQATSKPYPSQDRTYTPEGGNRTATPAPPCDQAGAGNPIDITIPDDSEISPGQSFIKTWKLVNIGSCTWTTSYSTSFFYGDRMDAPGSVPLKEAVLPANSVEISIEMVAPLAAGTYQGNWKLRNPSGVLFGIGPNGDSPFWVRIIVPINPPSTITATPGITSTFNPTGSPYPSITPTPPVQVKGELTPIPGDTIDLDTLTLNSNDKDLIYQVDTNNYHWLTPQDGAMIGVFGNLEPNLADCQSAAMSPAPIAVESLSIGTHLCYTTNQGRLGKALLASLDPSTFRLTLDLLTWALP